MKLSVMQPYFLPYIGYFQLMRAADIFVYYDDVTYIKQGWINRNNMLFNGEDRLFTLELKGASSFKNINQIEVGTNRSKLLRTFQQAYNKAPHYQDVASLLYRIFNTTETNLFQYILNTHKLIFDYIGVDFNCIVSSDIEKNMELKSQEKILDICRILHATTYVNAIGGQHLYSKETFKENGIDLFFIKAGNIPRRSILDVMMFHSPKEIVAMFDNYELI